MDGSNEMVLVQCSIHNEINRCVVLTNTPRALSFCDESCAMHCCESKILYCTETVCVRSGD